MKQKIYIFMLLLASLSNFAQFPGAPFPGDAPPCAPPTILFGSVTGGGCTGSASLSAYANSGTIKWYLAPTGGTPLTTQYPYTVVDDALYISGLSATTTFYAEAVNQSCVSTTRTAFTVNRYQKPTIGGQYFVPICEGNSATLNPTIVLNNGPLARGRQTYQWSTVTGSINGDANSASITVSQAGIYRLTVTNSNGCSTEQPFQLYVSTPPSAPEAAAQIFTSAATVADLVATGEGLKWYANADDEINLVSTTPLSTGTYYVSQTDIESGCVSARTAVQVNFDSCATPTLSTVTAAPACVGGTTTIVLSGMLPNTAGVATYTVNNGFPQTASGTSNANGTFSFPTPVLNALANNAVVKITKLATSTGCETIFTNKMVTLVVNKLPTLGTVTIVPACAGSTTTVTLSGLLPNTTGTATYKLGPFAPVTVSGTSDANGNLTLVTPVLTPGANGLVVSITNLTTTGGCSTNFTDKKVTVVVLAQPTLGTVTTSSICKNTPATINFNGLLPNSAGTVTYKVGNGPLQTKQGTTLANGTFSFETPSLSLGANGLVVTITRIETASGCVTNFTGKTVTLSVRNCRIKDRSVKENSTTTAQRSSIVTLYPNPIKDVLNIDSAIEIQSVQLLNMQGQQVLTATQNKINVSSLPPGTYMVRIQDTQNNVTVKRVIKN